MFYSQPKGLAAEGHFYADDPKHATEKSMALERWLAEEIEGPDAEAIAGPLQSRMLSSKQAHAFFSTSRWLREHRNASSERA
jgi:hypothetical protein